MSLRAQTVFFTSRMAAVPRTSRRHAQRTDPTLKSKTAAVASPDVAIGASTSDGSTPMRSAAQNRLRASQPGCCGTDTSVAAGLRPGP